MYLWRKNVPLQALAASEEALRARFGAAVAIISIPERHRVEIQIACRSKTEAAHLKCEFGGTIAKLSRDWQERFSRAQTTKAIKIGKRLVVSRNGDLPWRAVAARRRHIASARLSRTGIKEPPPLVIPAGMAFGTGDHPTTAMSLRLLEELTRAWNSRWSLVDLGTGSGILALAAKMFGAHRVVGIDTDPVAISTAKNNARASHLHGIDFRLCDARSWRPLGKLDIICANLLSELLIDLIPKLKRANWLILSGILREQENEIVCRLRRNRIDIVNTRRRGKWIAILAHSVMPAARTGS